jgi:hypothetical protein
MALDHLLGARVVATRPVGGGYTNARREIVTLADGRTAFVKTAVDDQTRGWIEAEQRIYAATASCTWTCAATTCACATDAA